MRILVINSGSSSIKYQFFKMPQKKVLTKGLIERIGQRGSGIKDHRAGLKLILKRIKGISAVGHRVVHGGEEFKEPRLIDDYVVRKIRQCNKLAPLHNPPALLGIEACKELLAGIPQVAVFDTSFYQTIPAYAYLYGLPYKYYQKYGIRRYGFHGTSHQYVAQEAAKRLKRPLKSLKLITCHLGNGCSITAIKGGSSIDTSMGFTPLEGLIMGTRSGDLDPAVVTFLMEKEKLSPGEMDEILNKKSGLKGLSGISNDIREIKEGIRRGERKAKLALEVFIYRIKKYIGAYTAIMSGADAIVFTGGIGENNPDIINKITRGVVNRSKTKVSVIPTNEELMIAEQTYRVMKKGVR